MIIDNSAEWPPPAGPSALCPSLVQGPREAARDFAKTSGLGTQAMALKLGERRVSARRNKTKE